MWCADPGGSCFRQEPKETYYLDRRGRIVTHSIGEVSEQDLEQGIKEAIRQGP